MYGFVKKGLLVSLASGALLIGGAGFASADSGTATGSTTGNEGAAAGNVVQVAGDNPINVCGDPVAVGTAFDGAEGNRCETEGNVASIDGRSKDSSGAVSGNVVGAALDVPVQVCGVAVQAASAASGAEGNHCSDTGTMATATATTDDDQGLLTGNIVQLSENAPISVCGDSVGALNYDSGAKGNSCENEGGPMMAPPPVTPPPPHGGECPPPPPPPVNCPPVTPPQPPSHHHHDHDCGCKPGDHDHDHGHHHHDAGPLGVL